MNPQHSITANDIEHLLSTQEARHFYHTTQNIWQKDKSFISYIAFNVSRDSLINCKLYASFFQKLTPAEVDALLPDTGSFYQHYDSWHPTAIPQIHETGCSFAVKLGLDGNIVDMFHYRMPFTDEIWQNLVLSEENREMLPHAFNYGFAEETSRLTRKKMQKHYFYMAQAEQKALLAERFKDPLMQEAGIIEYTQTHRYEKMIGWFEHHSELSKKYFSNINWPTIDYLIDWAKQYNCVPMSPGLYLNQEIRSIYFVQMQPTIKTEELHVNHSLSNFADFFKEFR